MVASAVPAVLMNLLMVASTVCLLQIRVSSKMNTDAFRDLNLSHSWISRFVTRHVYSLTVRCEMIQVAPFQTLYPRWSSVSSMVVEEFYHFGVIGNTSFPVFVRDYTRFVFHPMFDTCTPKSFEILKGFIIVQVLLYLFLSSILM